MNILIIAFTGVFWNIGNFFSVVAIPYIGYATAFPIRQGSIIVAGLWGIYYFKVVFFFFFMYLRNLLSYVGNGEVRCTIFLLGNIRDVGWCYPAIVGTRCEDLLTKFAILLLCLSLPTFYNSFIKRHVNCILHIFIMNEGTKMFRHNMPYVFIELLQNLDIIPEFTIKSFFGGKTI